MKKSVIRRGFRVKLAIIILLAVIITPVYIDIANVMIRIYDNFVQELMTEIAVRAIHDPAKKKLILTLNYFRKDKYDKTIALCRDLTRENLDLDDMREVYAMLGLSLGKKKRFSEEMQVYEELTAKDPAYGHFLKGVAFYEEERLLEAKKELLLAHKLNADKKDFDEKSEKILEDTLKVIEYLESEGKIRTNTINSDNLLYSEIPGTRNCGEIRIKGTDTFIMTITKQVLA